MTARPLCAVVRALTLLVGGLALALIASSPPADARPLHAASAGARLKWAPPRLERPITLRLGSGRSLLELNDRRDYILRFPPGLKRGATTIKGGRNVVVQGGWATIPRGARDDASRQAIYVKDTVGTVHLEGLLLQGTPGVSWDAIAINAPRARVQIENVRVEGVHGSFEGWHADVVQPFGGVRELRIDRLSATSNYQGLQIPPELGRIGGVDIRRVDLAYADTGESTGGKLVWLTTGLDSCAAPRVGLTDVYALPKPGRSLDSSVWPMAGSSLACSAVRQGASVSWPSLGVRGGVRQGTPPGGSYVARRDVGLRYRTPGFSR